MFIPVEKKQIVPFIPSTFPPSNLKKKSFSKDLKEARKAFKDFKKSLVLFSKSEQLLALLVKREAIASLDSQKISISLKEFIQANKKDPRAAPLFDYVEAFYWSCSHLCKTPYSKKQICKLHRIIKRSSTSKPDLGQYRNRQNWIGPSGCSIEQAYFYPPEKEKVDSLMNQLFNYMNQNTKEPLLQLALIFAQLLIIHPFMDGNGRIARTLIPFYLFKLKALPLPFFFLSSYFKIHRLQYFQTLFNITEDENWEDWIIFFFKGIIQSSKSNKHLLNRIYSLDANLKKTLPKLNRSSRLFLFQNPIFSITAFKNAKGSTCILQDLKRHKFIRQSKNNQCVFTPLMKILNNSLKK